MSLARSGHDGERGGGGEADGPAAPGKRPLTAGRLGGGAPLPGPLAAQMSRAFDADFSAVRVHEGEHVEAVGARAYALGHELHFAPGQLADTDDGRALVGHELAHVVQQGQGRVAPSVQAKGAGLAADVALEHEADRAGARSARGEPVEAVLRGFSPRRADGAAFQRAIYRDADNRAAKDGKDEKRPSTRLTTEAARAAYRAALARIAPQCGEAHHAYLAQICDQGSSEVRVDVAFDADPAAVVEAVLTEMHRRFPALVVSAASSDAAGVVHDPTDGYQADLDATGDTTESDDDLADDDEEAEVEHDDGEEADAEGDEEEDERSFADTAWRIPGGTAGRPIIKRKPAAKADAEAKPRRRAKKARTRTAQQQAFKTTVTEGLRRRLPAGTASKMHRAIMREQGGGSAEGRRRRDLDRLAWVLNQLDPDRVCVAVASQGDTLYLFANTNAAGLRRNFRRLMRALDDPGTRRRVVRTLRNSPSGARGAEAQARAAPKHATKAERRVRKVFRFLAGRRYRVQRPQARTPRHTHAEQQATQYAIDNRLRYDGMGISKLCCVKCWAALSAAAMNNLAPNLASGTHCKTYDSAQGWPVPPYVRDSPAVLREILTAEGAAQLAACPDECMDVLFADQFDIGGLGTTEPPSSGEDRELGGGPVDDDEANSDDDDTEDDEGIELSASAARPVSLTALARDSKADAPTGGGSSSSSSSAASSAASSSAAAASASSAAASSRGRSEAELARFARLRARVRAAMASLPAASGTGNGAAEHQADDAKGTRAASAAAGTGAAASAGAAGGAKDGSGEAHGRVPPVTVTLQDRTQVQLRRGWASGAGNNCLIHTILQHAFGEGVSLEVVRSFREDMTRRGQAPASMLDPYVDRAGVQLMNHFRATQGFATQVVHAGPDGRPVAHPVVGDPGQRVVLLWHTGDHYEPLWGNAGVAVEVQPDVPRRAAVAADAELQRAIAESLALARAAPGSAAPAPGASNSQQPPSDSKASSASSLQQPRDSQAAASSSASSLRQPPSLAHALLDSASQQQQQRDSKASVAASSQQAVVAAAGAAPKGAVDAAPAADDLASDERRVQAMELAPPEPIAVRGLIEELEEGRERAPAASRAAYDRLIARLRAIRDVH